MTLLAKLARELTWQTATDFIDFDSGIVKFTHYTLIRHFYFARANYLNTAFFCLCIAVVIDVRQYKHTIAERILIILVH